MFIFIINISVISGKKKGVIFHFFQTICQIAIKQAELCRSLNKHRVVCL